MHPISQFRPHLLAAMLGGASLLLAVPAFSASPPRFQYRQRSAILLPRHLAPRSATFPSLSRTSCAGRVHRSTFHWTLQTCRT